MDKNEYLRRIHLALTFIQAQLDNDINLRQVAAASHFSPYHFHRIFHALLGETVNDYIVRRRMERAAQRLICQPQSSITSIAEQGGFSSSANFARAFKAYFGISPSQLRKPHNQQSKIGKIYRKYGKAFNPADLYSQFVTQVNHFTTDELEEILMNVQVKELQQISVAYLTAPKGYELDAIFATWDKIIGWATAQGIDDQQRYAFLYDNPTLTPLDKCRYDACIGITTQTTVRAPFQTTKIPAGKYASAYFKGDGDKVTPFYTELYANWLPQSGFEPDDLPLLTRYLNDSRQDGYVEMQALIKLI